MRVAGLPAMLAYQYSGPRDVILKEDTLMTARPDVFDSQVDAAGAASDRGESESPASDRSRTRPSVPTIPRRHAIGALRGGPFGAPSVRGRRGAFVRPPDRSHGTSPGVVGPSPLFVRATPRSASSAPPPPSSARGHA